MITFFRVQHHVREAMDWAFTGWFSIPPEVEEKIHEEALQLAPEALRIAEERLSDELEFVTERDIALLAVAMATERVIDDIVLDWFHEDILRLIAREARVRAALAQRAQD